MKYFDSHCHLNDDSLYPIRKEVYERAVSHNVLPLLVVGWDVASSQKAIEIASEFEGVYALVGIHPENLSDDLRGEVAKIEALASDSKVVGIGEIGLDYHWFKDEESRAKQKEWFAYQLDLANRLNLPVSIHARDATMDTLQILRKHPVGRKGVLHCYSGSVESMAEVLKLGYYVGFDGPVTFKNAKEPKACVKACPIDRLLVETDSPYMAPTPLRGTTNEPKNIPLIVEEMAQIRGEEEAVLAERMMENLERLFRVKHG